MPATRGFRTGPGSTYYVGPNSGQVGPEITGATVPSRQVGQKDLMVHVYNAAGTTLLAAWKDMTNFPDFTWTINGGPSALTLTLPRAWGAAGEPGEAGSLNDIQFGNLVKLYVIDNDSGGDGRLIYQGIIDHYVQTLKGETVSVSLVPKTAVLGDRLITSIVTFTNADPTAMIAYFVANGYLPGVTIDATNPNVGVLYSPSFGPLPGTFVGAGGLFVSTFGSPEKLGQAFDRIQQLAGGKWYYRFNPDNSLTFNNWNQLKAADITLLIGKHVGEDVQFTKSRMDYKQRVVVIGAGVTATASINGYNPATEARDLYYANQRITDGSTALRIANSLLEYYNQLTLEVVVTVPDAAFDPVKGFDIEQFTPGMTVSLVNPDNRFNYITWGGGNLWGDGSIWGGSFLSQVQKPLVISEVHYHFDSVTLTLRNRVGELPEEVLGLADRLLLVAA